MEKEKKPNNPKFNMYWFYGLVVAIWLGTTFFGGRDSLSNAGKINISKFENYLDAGDIKEVLIIRNKSSVQVSLKPEALSKQEHANVRTTTFLGQENIAGPHYQFEVGSLELFEEKLEMARNQGIDFRWDFITVENRWMDVFISFLPIIIIIGVWIFLMRRMSGGGAGGPGGQIFNIGKSKACLLYTSPSPRDS